MATPSTNTAPAATNAGTSKHIIARFCEEDGGTVYSIELTLELLAKVRGAVKYTKKESTIVRIKLPAQFVRIVYCDSLSSKAIKQLADLDIDVDGKGETVVSELTIPKRCLGDCLTLSKDEFDGTIDEGVYEGIYVEVGSDACRANGCKAVLISYNLWRLTTYHVNYGPLDDALLG